LQAVFTHAYSNVPFNIVSVSCYSFLEKPRALVAEELYFRDCKDSGLFIKSVPLSFLAMFIKALPFSVPFAARSYVPQNQLQKKRYDNFGIK
jgi:hypothetical protein